MYTYLKTFDTFIFIFLFINSYCLYQIILSSIPHNILIGFVQDNSTGTHMNFTLSS